MLEQRYLPLNEQEFSMDRSRQTVQTQLTHYVSGDSCQASDQILGIYAYFMCENSKGPEENAQVLVTYSLKNKPIITKNAFKVLNVWTLKIML